MIEAVTYRLGPHTTADDPGRYRAPDLTEDWRRRDPLERVRLFLSEREAWSEFWQQQIENEAAEEVDLAIERAEGMAPFGPGEIFDAMFETLPPHLAAQRIEATQQ